MERVLARTAAIPAASPQPRKIAGRIRRLMLAVAWAAAERVTSPPRDVPPEFFRFPMP
jgi:hypothetical protein